MKLPMRARILHLLYSSHKALTLSDIMQNIFEEYKDEKQFRKNMVDLHLESMRAVGLIEVTNVKLAAKDELEEYFSITEYGIARLQYLPEKWKKIG